MASLDLVSCRPNQRMVAELASFTNWASFSVHLGMSVDDKTRNTLARFNHTFLCRLKINVYIVRYICFHYSCPEKVILSGGPTLTHK